MESCRRSLERLRRVLGEVPESVSVPSWVPKDPPPRRAAVFIPLFWREGGWHLLLCRRSWRLRHHPGHVAFPGGSFDDQLDRTLLDTALRELREETGLEGAEVLGCLPRQFTGGSHYVITPYVGVVEGVSCARPDGEEIVELLEVPLSFFQDVRNLHTEVHMYGGEEVEVSFFYYKRWTIWGATARIIRNLVLVFPS